MGSETGSGQSAASGPFLIERRRQASIPIGAGCVGRTGDRRHEFASSIDRCGVPPTLSARRSTTPGRARRRVGRPPSPTHSPGICVGCACLRRSRHLVHRPRERLHLPTDAGGTGHCADPDPRVVALVRAVARGDARALHPVGPLRTLVRHGDGGDAFRFWW